MLIVFVEAFGLPGIRTENFSLLGENLVHVLTPQMLQARGALQPAPTQHAAHKTRIRVEKRIGAEPKRSVSAMPC